MPTPAKLTKDKAAAVALRPETVEFFARVKAFLGQRQESERLYAELCAAAPEAARRRHTLRCSTQGPTAVPKGGLVERTLAGAAALPEKGSTGSCIRTK